MTLLLTTRMLLATLLAAVSLPSAENGAPIDVLRDVGIDQRLDNQVPLDLTFRDESGATVKLADYFDGKPVILVMAYYRCPMLCTQVLNGLTETLRGIDFEIGKQFRVVTVSFDPHEGPELAARKKENYAAVYGRDGAESGWHFLTGDEDSIARLSKAVGFRYAFDSALNQYAHASGIMVLTPQGRLSHYFLGINYPSRDVRLALVEASQGRIGSPVDRLLLLCYHYDPATGKYYGATMTFVRLAAIATVLLLSVPIARAWLRDWRHPRPVVAN